ncbi:hypothetical protein JD844_015085 [Phrynosoma platyrhinos]|uniref:Uncharacterized protein n=1 Tax=Phrynosoma platyrhinos TaxID=52577 RepID=A0ABQ7T7B2_PHRPL|nr:hypothetical protein JD844_015085 [Phrynosoma platyrhinos]
MVPFLELHGESTEYVGRAEEAVIALSNYRLHIKFKESLVNCLKIAVIFQKYRGERERATVWKRKPVNISFSSLRRQNWAKLRRKLEGGGMLALPLDELRLTEKNSQTGKMETLPALKCLDSYLRHAPRKFDAVPDTAPEDHFITPSVFGEILYNNFLFDIPKILDLCVLFGKGNGALLRKMVGELSAGLIELADIVLYLCDATTTLWAFLDVFPLACQTFQKHDFCYRLSAFYELVIPELESAIKKRYQEDYSLLSDLWRRLSHSRKKAVEIFHIFVHQLCLQPILESR